MAARTRRRRHCLTAANLKIGTPILGIDLRQLHWKIKKIGWVENAVVERRLPGIIRISLRERIPIALLQNNGKHELIDHSGTIIDGADPSQFTHLTVVSGKKCSTTCGRDPLNFENRA